MHPKVFVVGAGGMVGAAVAHTLAVTETAHDIRLIDVAAELVAGQAADISHATSHTRNVKVSVGEYSQIAKDDIVVITCGLAQKPGQSRLDLLKLNAAIIDDVVKKVMTQGEEVFILMVSNPVDVLTQVALESSGLPKHRVMGSGTSLDTARLRVKLSEQLNVVASSINAYILGEHGDSSFPALSGATVAGLPLSSLAGNTLDPSALSQEIRAAAYKIIDAKKSTYFGIGQVVTRIVSAMQNNKAEVFPVCSLAEGEYGLRDVVIGLPSLVNAGGVHVVDGYPLNSSERAQQAESAAVVKQAYDSMRVS